MERSLIEKEQLPARAAQLKDAGWRLALISGVDQKEKFQVVYHFHKLLTDDLLQLSVDLPQDHPAVPSLASLFPLADWMERETYDLVGIIFQNHPNLTRLFLPDSYEGHPLRKDFTAYKRILPGA